MKITIANSAGFCFGVSRAIKMVDELILSGKKVCTLGPIIHNTQMVEKLSEQGVEIADTPQDVSKGATLVIRSHGIPMNIMDQIKEKEIEFVDATCPFVSKIHRIVRKASEEGKVVLIAGDENHPEVEGIRGNCFSESYVFDNAEEFQKLHASCPNLWNRDVIIVAQTTFSVSEWRKCLEIVKKVYTNATVFDTICNATSDRQAEAEQLSKKSDLMIIIGGKHSSNTAKLRDICERHCETCLIETAKELPFAALKKANCVGITAGASTPASIIKEVLEAMTEALNNNGVNEEKENEMNFEEMLEESLKNLNTDEKVHGVVVGIAPNEIYVDVGRKQAGFVPLSELSVDPNAKPEDLVKIGDEMDLLIMRTNDQEGTIMLSKKRLDAIKGWEDVVKAHEEDTILEGTVLNVVKGGVIAVTNGVRVFIPASQATASRHDPLEGLVKKSVRFKIIEINKGRRRAVASIRAVLKDERKKLAEKFWENAEVGKTYTGIVRSLTNYGAFVDLGGIDGMIHISELSWSKIKHPSEIVNVGDTVEVYIKDLDKENEKISLGYKKTEENPWEILKENYPIGKTVDVEIVGMTSFGAFARIIPGIDGLIHISQIADHRIEKPQDELTVGDKVKAVITDIDFEKKRVSLSIRALLEENKKAEAGQSAE